jgi:SSS family solute:Na+ symporter
MFLGIIVVYFCCILAIGILSYGRINKIADFYVADRKLGLLATTSTLSATTIGGSAIIASAIYIYTKGLPGLWMNLAAAIGLIVLGLGFASKVRGMAVFSLPELAGRLYDEKVRLLGSILTIIAETAWLALLIQATQLIVTAITDLSPTAALYLSAAVFMLYTVLGGQYAVAYSDVLQFGVMVLGILFLGTPIVLVKAEFLTGLSSEVMKFPVNSNFTFMNLISMIFLMGLPHLVGSDIYSKLLSAKDEATAKRAAFLSGIFRILFGIAVAVMALGALVLYPDLSSPAQIFPKMIKDLLPLPISAIVLAAFLSTMMSSADTVLLTASIVFTNDIYKGHRKLMISRVSVVVFGILGLALALYLQDLIKTLELAYTFFASGMIIPIIAGFYRRRLRVNSTGALGAMISGGGTALALKLGQARLDAILVGMGVSLVFIFGLSWVKNSLPRRNPY